MADLEEMADALDRAMLSMLKTGKKTIMGHDGSPTEVDLTAADYNVIRQRLKDCGITTPRAKGNPIDELARRMGGEGDTLKFPGADLPDLDDAPDAATA